MARAKTDGKARTVAEAEAEGPLRAAVEEADIARRAYDLYLARGRDHGHDVDDWLQAERDVRGATTLGAGEESS